MNNAFFFFLDLDNDILDCLDKLIQQKYMPCLTHQSSNFSNSKLIDTIQLSQPNSPTNLKKHIDPKTKKKREEKGILQRGLCRWEERGCHGVASESQEGHQTERSHEWWAAWQILSDDRLAYASSPNQCVFFFWLALWVTMCVSPITTKKWWKLERQDRERERIEDWEVVFVYIIY